MRELIEKQTAIDAINRHFGFNIEEEYGSAVQEIINGLPSAQPEPLTDEEQRIFLSAMERELRVCEEIDCEAVWEGREAKLVKICKEIKRKVMGALWT